MLLSAGRGHGASMLQQPVARQEQFGPMCLVKDTWNATPHRLLLGVGNMQTSNPEFVARPCASQEGAKLCMSQWIK